MAPDSRRNRDVLPASKTAADPPSPSVDLPPLNAPFFPLYPLQRPRPLEPHATITDSAAHSSTSQLPSSAAAPTPKGASNSKLNARRGSGAKAKKPGVEAQARPFQQQGAPGGAFPGISSNATAEGVELQTSSSSLPRLDTERGARQVVRLPQPTVSRSAESRESESLTAPSLFPPVSSSSAFLNESLNDPLSIPAILSNNESTAAQIRCRAAEARQRRKTGKPRKKWTEKETQDLMAGVEMFGAGSWNKILKYRGFCFNGRSSVDLKDRFRTCSKKNELANLDVEAAPVDPAFVSSFNSTSLDPGGGKDRRCPSSPRSQVTPPAQGEVLPINTCRSQLEATMHGVFMRSARRERRPFTTEEDNDLQIGLHKHGYSWVKILNDPELHFPGRSGTDIRDRVRAHFPEKYKAGGYKGKPSMSDRPAPPRTNETISATETKEASPYAAQDMAVVGPTVGDVVMTDPEPPATNLTSHVESSVMDWDQNTLPRVPALNNYNGMESDFFLDSTASMFNFDPSSMNPSRLSSGLNIPGHTFATDFRNNAQQQQIPPLPLPPQSYVPKFPLSSMPPPGDFFANALPALSNPFDDSLNVLAPIPTFSTPDLPSAWTIHRGLLNGDGNDRSFYIPDGSFHSSRWLSSLLNEDNSASAETDFIGSGGAQPETGAPIWDMDDSLDG
ncbi:MAG: hypothetical protein M4579_003478 [Chaenotheca gracillima]|nr:MAG: hypothetical protein M4579_003478 [Chaenotheca gracillima]